MHGTSVRYALNGALGVSNVPKVSGTMFAPKRQDLMYQMYLFALRRVHLTCQMYLLLLLWGGEGRQSGKA